MTKFFTSHTGELVRNDSSCEVVRKTYKRHFVTITSARELLACLRAGKYTDLGGYQCWFYTSDGGTLSFDAVQENLESVLCSIRHGINDGWQVIHLESACNDDSEIICDHTGEMIQESWEESE